MTKGKIFFIIILMIFLCLFCAVGGFWGARFFESAPRQLSTEQKEVEPTEKEKTEEKSMPKDGPYVHAIYFATSQNGVNWDLVDSAVVEHASVPELVELNQNLGEYPQGTLLSYFVDASELTERGKEKIGLVSSIDGGKTWSEKKTIILSGEPEGLAPVDPSVFQLDNGQLRLYFFDIMGGLASGQGEAGKPQTGTFYSALSADGENFIFEGEVFSATAATDPEVVFFNNQWLMYYAGEGGIRLATSSNGQRFDEENSLRLPGIPGAIVVDNQVFVYTCQRGVSYAISSDGKNFSEIKSTNGFALPDQELTFCDGSPVVLSDGGFGMMMKASPAVEDLRRPGSESNKE